MQKVLVVCSVGQLRSPTIANALHKEFGYNTRSCGSIIDEALIPISAKLIEWADVVFFVKYENFDMISDDLKKLCKGKTITSNIPDIYDYGDTELAWLGINTYKHYANFL